MIVAGVGQVGGSDGRKAARDAAREAISSADTTRSDVAILLATPDHRVDLGTMVDEVRRETHASEVIAATVAGTSTLDGEIEDSGAVAVMVLGGEIGARPFLVPTRNRGFEAGSEVGDLAGPHASLIVLLADPAGLDACKFLEGLAEICPCSVVAGAGLAGGLKGAVQVFNDRQESGHVVGVAFTRKLKTAVATSQACRPLGPAMQVTSSNQNIVLTIDGRPALEVFAEAAGDPTLGGDVSQGAQLLLVGLCVGEGEDEYLTRPVVGFDSHSNAFAISEDVQVGQRIVFTVREALGARDDLRQRVRQALSELGSPPRLGFYFNCAGRGSNLYGAHNVDSATQRQILGELPLLGCFSSFEVGMMAGSPRMQLFSGVTAFLAE